MTTALQLTMTAAIHARLAHRVDGLVHSHPWSLEATVEGPADADKVMPADDLEAAAPPPRRAVAGKYLTDTDIGEWKGYAPLVWDREPTVEEIARRHVGPAGEAGARPGVGRRRRVDGVRPLPHGAPVARDLTGDRLRRRPGRRCRRAAATTPTASPLVTPSQRIGAACSRLGVLRRRRPRTRRRAGRRVRRRPPLLRPAGGRQGAIGDGRQQRLRRHRVGPRRRQGDARHRADRLRPLARPRTGSGTSSSATRRRRWRWPPTCCGRWPSALDIDAGFFAERMRQPQCFLRLLRYPADPATSTTGRHTDYGAITLLATDGGPGWRCGRRRRHVAPGGGAAGQPRRQPRRHAGPLDERPIRLDAPPRRVRRWPPSGYSIPFFVNPDPGTAVACIPSCVTRRPPVPLRADHRLGVPPGPHRRHDHARRRPASLASPDR